MKSIFFFFAFTATLMLCACNSQDKSAKSTEPEVASTSGHASHAETSQTRTITASFTTVDPSAAGAIHEVIGQYLAVKNALASDHAKQAAEAAGHLGEVLKKVDKSLLTAEQKTAFDKSSEVIGQQAANIAGSGGDIAVQRSSFFALSESVYALSKQFGGGRKLYHDHCPMARDNQGALWISEQQDIRNPYFGAGMLTCGTVEEVIQ